MPIFSRTRWGPALAKLRSFLPAFLLLLLPFGLYAAILLIRSPYPFRPIAVPIRYSFLTTLGGAGVFLYALFNLRGRLGALAAFTGVLALFALSLLGLWISADSSATALSGLLPMADNASYYFSALRLMAGGSFEPFAAWRPLFPGLLSFVLAFTGGHLQIAAALLVLIPAIACFLLTREIQRTHGPLVAAATMLILFFYYRQRISGMFATEQLGLAFGALGLALAWRSAATRQPSLLVLGVFTLGLGLNARPGPFFLLPALILWGGWDFRGEKRYSWPVFLLGGLAAAASFLVNSFVLHQITSEPTMLFSNFAYTLYGLVNGGTHYYSFAQDHPEALAGSGSYLRAYQIVLETFLRNPTGILKGAWSEWTWFFSNSMYGVFSYMAAESALVTRLARLGLYALSGAGLAGCVLRRRDPHSTLVLASAAAVLLSVPFVPPGDSYGMRLYAAGLPVIAVVPALGLSLLAGRPLARVPWLGYRPALNPRPLGRTVPAVVAIFLAVVVALSPAAVKWFYSRPVAIAGQACPGGLETLTVRLSAGSYVNVYPESRFFLDRMPDFHRSRFIKGIHGFPDTALSSYFDQMAAPKTLYEAIDLSDYRAALLVIDPGLLPAREGLFRLCGQWGPESVRSYHVFEVEQVETVGEIAKRP